MKIEMRCHTQTFHFLRSTMLCMALFLALLCPNAQAQEGVSLFETLSNFLKPKVQPGPTTLPAISAADAIDSPRGIRRNDSGSPQNGQRLALIIGNDAYQRVTPLRNARNDASLMASTLKKAGFDVMQMGNLTRDGMFDALDTFKGRIHSGDEVVFYFAGHGVQISSNQLILPTDIESKSDQQVQRDGVSLVDVQDSLKVARFSLLVIDACRDNPFPKVGTRAIGSGTRGLMPPEPITGQAIIMSAGRNQTALDNVPGQSQSNGLFTWQLAQALQTPGLEIRQALEEVKNRVDDSARSVGHEQRPSFVNDLRGNFYFFGATTVQVQQDSDSVAETSAWAAAEGANTVTAYQAYLVGYPKGRYVLAAKIKLDALAQAAASSTVVMPSTASNALSAAVATDPEAALWNEVKTSAAREYFDAYLKQYPKGKYVSLARVELKRLDEMDRQEHERQAVQRKQQELNAWSDAKAKDSDSAYNAYLASYPLGQFVAIAKAAKSKLQREDNERHRQSEAQIKSEKDQISNDLQLKDLVKTASTKQQIEIFFSAAPEKLNRLKSLAAFGDAESQGLLALLLLDGWGVAKDVYEGYSFAKKSATQGSVVGQLAMGYAYARGFGIDRSYAESFKWYRLAADHGEAEAQANVGAMLRDGRGTNKDEAEAIKWLRKAADQNNANAQAQLGISYASGRGVAKDDAEAVKWFRKSAEKNHMLGLTQLGLAYQNGRGIAKDEPEGIKWFRKAADQENSAGQNNLGIAYQNGRGVAKDEFEAIKWFRKAADQEDSNGQVNLGLAYQNGRGVAKDELEAIKWIRKAAVQESAYGQLQLGYAYQNGRGVTKDETEAVRLFKLAADQAYAPGQFQFGFMLANGKGISKDEAEAVKWFRKAAEQNNASAQNWLGAAYQNGRGTTKDEAEAVRLYKLAADQGSAEAQFNLGVMLTNGKGITQDEVEAVKWFRKAAEQNYAGAQNWLGYAYQNGRGVSKDETEAVRFYRLAANQGLPDAQKNIGMAYRDGTGVTKDEVEAVNWFRKSAEQNNASGQTYIGYAYETGRGIGKDEVEAVKWYKLAANQGNPYGQRNLGMMYRDGRGVSKDTMEAKRLIDLAASQGVK